MFQCSARRWCGVCRTRLRRARRTFAGVQQAWAAVERQALLEEAMTQPALARAVHRDTDADAHPPATTAAYLRDLADTAKTTTVTVTESHEDVTPVASLAQFFAECKRHRIAFGNAHERVARAELRDAFRAFWHAHVGSAVRCCALRGRDFGFLASHGLADSALHLPVAALQPALDALVAELAVCSAVDVCSSLHYLARELHAAERRSTPQPPAGLRRALTDVAVERIVFFFVQHAPPSQSARTDTAARSPCDTALATAEDALHALETLSYLRVEDASSTTLRAAHEVFVARSASSSSSSTARPPRREKGITHADLVARLFNVVAQQRRQLRFTSLVQAFALLRIFLPCLLPNARPDPRNRRSGGNMASPDAARERLSRLTWALARELRHRDAHLINSYHFVKIAMTLERLPGFVLAPTAGAGREPRRHLRSLALLPLQSTKDATARSTARHFLPPETFWHYIVSKACIFAPSLSPAQRRAVVHALRTAIVEKRGRVLGQSGRDTLAPPLAKHVDSDRSSAVTTQTSSGDTAEQILLPLMQEMQRYGDDFDRDVRGRDSV